MTVVVVEGEMQVAVAGIRQVVPLLFYKVDEYEVSSCIHNKMALNCVKNYANWFRRFEDRSSQTYCPQFFWATLQVPVIVSVY